MRVKYAYSLKNDAEIAEFLGVSPSTIATWKSRNTFPFEILVAKCKDVDWNWLIFGSLFPAKSKTVTEGNIVEKVKDTEKNNTNSRIESVLTYLEPLSFPGSAREMVESYVTREGRIDWHSIPVNIQSKLKWKYERCRLDSEEAYKEYQRVSEKVYKTYERTLEQINLSFYRYFLNLMEEGTKSVGEMSS